MKIRVLRNLAKPHPPYGEGEVVTCDDGIAKALIEAGLAEIVEDPKPPRPQKQAAASDKT